MTSTNYSIYDYETATAKAVSKGSADNLSLEDWRRLIVARQTKGLSLDVPMRDLAILKELVVKADGSYSYRPDGTPRRRTCPSVQAIIRQQRAGVKQARLAEINLVAESPEFRTIMAKILAVLPGAEAEQAQHLASATKAREGDQAFKNKIKDRLALVQAVEHGDMIVSSARQPVNGNGADKYVGTAKVGK